MDNDVIIAVVLSSIIIIPHILIQFDSYVYKFFLYKETKENK